MKVFTYHDAAVGLTRPELIELWKRSWAKNGFDPVVIGPEEAIQHPNFSEFHAAVGRFPTTNPRAYEDACYLRWLAMETSGGGLMVDTDVMNYGFGPDNLHLANSKGDPYSGMVCLEPSGVPCAVFGPREGYEYVWKKMRDIGSNSRLEHISDMTLFQLTGPTCTCDCSEFMREWNGRVTSGRIWHMFPLVHFSTGSMIRVGRSRDDKHLVIQERRPV